MDRIRLNASEWMDFRSGEKKCFLLTNGLGGYCSLTVMGNAARNDQALLMGALKAPTVREHLISNVWETLEVDGEETELFSQEFFGSAGDAVCGEGGAAAGGAGFCGGPEVYCEQWCDSFLWDKWGASDGEGEDLEGFVF